MPSHTCQQSPQGCLQNSANVCVVEHRLFPTLEGVSIGCFLSPLIFPSGDQMFWCSGLSKFREFLNPLSSKQWTGCDVCCVYQSACSVPLIPAWPAQCIHSSLCCWRLNGCVPVRAAHLVLHLLQQVHWVCENEGIYNIEERLVKMYMLFLL